MKILLSLLSLLVLTSQLHGQMFGGISALKFRGRVLSQCTPTNGQVYAYNSTTRQWECVTQFSSSTPSGQLYVYEPAGVTSVTIKAGSGQGVTAPFKMLSNVDVEVFNISPAGALFAASSIVIGSKINLTSSPGVGAVLSSDTILRFQNGTSIFTGAADLGIGRSAAGVLEINNGTAGAGGGLKIFGLKSTTGTRYLCIDTTGLITSSATACSGT